ncbi:MAG: TonB-dependent receptor, partial [Bryobacteraceae bacterium]
MQILFLLIVFLAASPLMAQSITGSIAGSVEDGTRLPVSGASVTLTQVATGATRSATTSEQGGFIFSSLQPGQYHIAVQSAGFKTAEKRSLVLSAAETLAAGSFVLEIGSVTETVSVVAQGSTVQTASSERAGVITGSQVNNLLIRNRNITSLLQLLPGIVDTSADDRLARTWQISSQGSRRAANNVWMDGMSLNASNNVNSVVAISMDAVEEVKVLQSNYQAEYGRMIGANIQLVTKSGSREFHGLGSYFKRHEQFNANEFFNNRLGQPKQRYRYNTWNYNIGGPVYIPGKFNRDRNKLFFFFSQEYWPLKVSRPVGQVTVPTEAERTGDFSQSLDLNRRLIVITDPTTGAPFPGNRIPAARVDPSGAALLKVFPVPNFFDLGISAGRYNYIFQSENSTPQRTETLRVDWNINARNLLFGNFTGYSDIQEGALGIATSGGINWPQLNKRFSTPGRIYIGRYQRIFSPTLVNELNIGFTRRPEFDEAVSDAELKRNQRDTVGFRAG